MTHGAVPEAEQEMPEESTPPVQQLRPRTALKVPQPEPPQAPQARGQHALPTLFAIPSTPLPQVWAEETAECQETRGVHMYGKSTVKADA